MIPIRSLTLLLSLLPATSWAAEGMPINPSDPAAHNLGLGRVVFTEQCIKCHGDPQSGAPQLGRVEDWEDRLATPLPTLIDHAINGHGKMPPKGGLEELTDRHVAAAVAYVVDRSRSLFVEYEGKTVPLSDKLCANDTQASACRPSQIDNTLLLQMLWLITGQERE